MTTTCDDEVRILAAVARWHDGVLSSTELLEVLGETEGRKAGGLNKVLCLGVIPFVCLLFIVGSTWIYRRKL